MVLESCFTAAASLASGSAALATSGLPFLPLAAFVHYFFGILMSVVAIFLILLILVQRGRGGGLAGAFGGMGGQSAFGTKAGDTFTRITIVAAIAWILVCVASVKFLSSTTGSFGKAVTPGSPSLVPAPRPALPAWHAGYPGYPGCPGDDRAGGTSRLRSRGGDASRSGSGDSGGPGR
jgi:preprotein translocase subunit SecG